MPSYKLMYFDVRGYGETARMLFAVAGVHYDDNRVDIKDWMALKPKMPFMQLPVLQVDNTMIAQSNAISRYLADTFGLMGKNTLEKAVIDACVETITELRVQIMSVQIKEIPKDQKDKEMKAVLEQVIPPILEKLEHNLNMNKSGGKYFSGDKMSLADIHFYACTETVVRLNPKAFDKYPKLAALYNRVKNDNKIQKWVAQRPDSEV